MSRIAYLLSIIIILLVHFCYYPKWQKKGMAATISWDVSGYYLYLPAAFIYKDLKELEFKDTVLKKYNPQPGFAQAFKHEDSGNYVMKYSIGQAVVYSPFFLIAHLWATKSTQFPADGFAFPYQFMLSIGMLLWTIIGLTFLRKSLLLYFSDKVTALGLLGIVLGSNYLNYAAIDGAMTHNTVFTLYALLIYLSIRIHQNPTWAKAIGIGICIGLASLIRPTEIISSLIPALWGLSAINKEQLFGRIEFLKAHSNKLLAAVIVTALIGCIQIAYWKYATGDWIVYSYQDQGFSWLTPHILDGMFSYRSGWLVYSPFMIFSLIGFIALFKMQRHLFIPTFIFSGLFIYIAFAWDIWWYGGSLGQRAMVQSYPILAFPLCAFVDSVLKSRRLLIKAIVAVLSALFIYANVWFTHQCHHGALLHVGRMNKQYFWKTLFTYEKNPEDIKLLDGAHEIYEEEPKNIRTVYNEKDFYQVVNLDKVYSDLVSIPKEDLPDSYDWIRVSADIFFEHKEWTWWNMTQLIVRAQNKDKVQFNRSIRIQNLADANKKTNLYIDVRKPKKPFTHIDILFWNSESKIPVEIKNLKVEAFEK